MLSHFNIILRNGFLNSRFLTKILYAILISLKTSLTNFKPQSSSGETNIRSASNLIFFSYFTELKVSLPRSQKPFSGTYPGPPEFIFPPIHAEVFRMVPSIQNFQTHSSYLRSFYMPNPPQFPDLMAPKYKLLPLVSM